MKLQLITAGVIAYTIATMVWLCYVGLGGDAVKVGF
jgi:hypothetical protein